MPGEFQNRQGQCGQNSRSKGEGSKTDSGTGHMGPEPMVWTKRSQWEFF